jgi:hypothetical protein
MKKPYKGFRHSPGVEQIKEYRRWSLERRCRWLEAGSRLRRCLPARVIEIQERFRRGEI